MLVLVLLANSARAHEFTELKIDSFYRPGNGPYLEILLSNTVKGRQFVCILTNEEGKVVAYDRGWTRSLATRVLINFPYDVEVKARCVFDD